MPALESLERVKTGEAQEGLLLLPYTEPTAVAFARDGLLGVLTMKAVLTPGKPMNLPSAAYRGLRPFLL